MKINQTSRGFDIAEFVDRYGVKCSLQKSSLATEDAIWLGVDDADPKIMVSDAITMGLRERTFTEADNGWCRFPVPPEVQFTTRMHLTVEQVKELLPILQHFVETGELS